jgi:hypothetical protein
MRAFFPDAITLRRAGWFDKQGKDEEKAENAEKRGEAGRGGLGDGEFPSRDKLVGIFSTESTEEEECDRV